MGLYARARVRRWPLGYIILFPSITMPPPGLASLTIR